MCGIDGYLHFLDACAGILIYLILLAKRLFKLAVCIQPEKSLKYEIEYLNRIFIRICDSRVEIERFCTEIDIYLRTVSVLTYFRTAHKAED
ncbi:unknown [Candidatus Apopatosoma intestinale]|nr:unknown [Candidatus Apopatosoma intestinale]